MLVTHLSKRVLLLLLVLSGWAQADTQYNQIFIFGDSLSDTGNLASVTQNFPAPYYMSLGFKFLAQQFAHSFAR